MDTIIICLIVTIIGYCLINQIEVNELCAELDELKGKATHKEFRRLDKALTNTLDEFEEQHFDEIALIKSRLLDLELAKAVEDCPHNEILHYHHDGCPACHKIYKYDGRIFPTEELEAN